MRPHCHARTLVSMSLVMLLVGCTTLIAPTVTPTVPLPSPTPVVTRTIDPAASGPSAIERTYVALVGTTVAQFTHAAPPIVIDGPGVATVTFTPLPTQVSIPMQFFAADGLRLIGTYYGAPRRPAAAVLLIHDSGGSGADWEPFARLLQTGGANVLAIDLRGHGQTGGSPDASRVVADVQIVLDSLRALPTVLRNQVSAAGAGLGANVALALCAQNWERPCRNLALISPTLDAQGISAQAGLAAYGERPILIAAGRGGGASAVDTPRLSQLARGVKRVLLYDGAEQGISLLIAQPTLSDIVARWLLQ